MNRYLLLWLTLALSACGGTSGESPEPGLTITRLTMPDSSQTPFEVTVQTEQVTCTELACQLDLELPLAPAELHVLDVLGNEFTFPVDDLSAGPHLVEAPLAPEAGVFLPYTLEYTVVR